MLTCARCEAKHETIGALAAHIAYAHVLPDDRAMAEAQRVAGSCPGCGRTSGAHNKACPHTEWQPAPPPVRPAAPKPARPVAVVADARQDSATDSAPRNPAPSALPNPPAPKETPMATHSRRSDPTACKLCLRLTKKAGEPTKCKWHGGAGRSTSNRGKGPKKDQATRRPAKPEPVVANGNGKFAAHITGLKQAVASGLLAQAELDGYKAALEGAHP